MPGALSGSTSHDFCHIRLCTRALDPRGVRDGPQPFVCSPGCGPPPQVKRLLFLLKQASKGGAHGVIREGQDWIDSFVGQTLRRGKTRNLFSCIFFNL